MNIQNSKAFSSYVLHQISHPFLIPDGNFTPLEQTRIVPKLERKDQQGMTLKTILIQTQRDTMRF